MHNFTRTAKRGFAGSLSPHFFLHFNATGTKPGFADSLSRHFFHVQGKNLQYDLSEKKQGFMVENFHEMALLKVKGREGVTKDEMCMLKKYHKMLLLDKLNKDKHDEGATQGKMSNVGSTKCTIECLSNDIVCHDTSECKA